MLDNRLSFNKHVSTICRKAGQQLDALKRLACCCINHLFTRILTTPLQCGTCGKVNTAKLERVQLRALRFIYNGNDSSYETLLASSGLCTLKLDRTSKVATEVYKSVNDLSPSYICNLFQTKSSTYNFRKSGLNVNKNSL